MAIITTTATARRTIGACVAVCATWLLAYGCGSAPPSSLGPDAAAVPDAHTDASAADASPLVDAAAGDQDTGISFACTLEELQPIGECAQANCTDTINLDAGIDPTALVTCITTNCWMQLLAVSPGCRECLTTAVGGNLNDILAQCSSFSLGG